MELLLCILQRRENKENSALSNSFSVMKIGNVQKNEVCFQSFKEEIDAKRNRERMKNIKISVEEIREAEFFIIIF